MDKKIKIAKELTAKLVDSLRRAEWLKVAAGLKVGKALHASPKLYGQWVKENFPSIAGQPATDAVWLLDKWTDVEPYTLPGQPMANVNHPTTIKQMFTKLAAVEETPAAEGQRINNAAAVELQPPAPQTDTLSEFLTAQAAKAQVSVEEFQLLAEGLAVDIQQRKQKQSATINRKTFASPREALAWLAFAAWWTADNTKSLKARAMKLRQAAADLWSKARHEAVVALPNGQAGLDLAYVEDALVEPLKERKALMEIKVGAIYTADAVGLAEGKAKALFFVDDHHEQRAAVGLLSGVLMFQYEGEAVEVESLQVSIEGLKQFNFYGMAKGSDAETKHCMLEVAKDKFFGRAQI